ncbi:DivIVA domain-containing protein [Clostridium bovifaecis]|uniref:DivIVA domain-containing protein n=1 Tax=Clostridium bovifaecis TaxID=2184719 RepID=A0A6I6FBH1_9CLOT|nr:DivIVA domain-containing protein [Clostridium bovifaecis]
MVITSMDINNKEFKKSLRGYDCDEVDEFLDKIAEDYEVIYKENSSLKEKVEILEERLRHYAQIEENIQKTLLLAQTAAEQARATAQSESELLVRQANESAQKIIDKAHNDVVKIHDNYETIRQEFLKFRAQFKSFMNAQLDTFSSLEKEFMKNYNVGNAVDISDIKPKEIDEKLLEDTEEFNDVDLDVIKSFFVKEN